MMKRLILAAALAAALAAPASAQDLTGSEFVKKAIQGNLAEVQMGKLAEQKGGGDGVRSYGRQLQQDHAKANTKAKDVAKAVKMEPPTEPSKEQKDAYERLAKLAGGSFDREFIEHAIEDHERDIREYENAAKSFNATVAKYASDTLPDLRKHLEMARALKNQPTTTGSR